jgi:2-keto-4-pentenoate hydratase/2-oxohepta-3-ene-1,7-dioic acid hydratase in catechol pathway
LGTIAEHGGPVTVIELDGRLLRLETLDGAWPEGPRDVLGILRRWDEWEPALSAAASASRSAAASLAPEAVTWLPPILTPSKLVCVGANYRDHVDEMGDDKPTNTVPYAFLKPPSTLLGGGGSLHLPAGATWIDWEAELAIVIGRRMRFARGPEALAGVAGYTMFNDVSNRDNMDSWQPVIGMDWLLHKGWDGFGPAGPLITPSRFVGDPQRLGIELTVNGQVKQSSNTSKMIFGVQAILEHLTSVLTLEPGDLISTGSPAGVGYGRTPRERLVAGDEVVISIERLGPPLVTHVVDSEDTA